MVAIRKTKDDYQRLAAQHKLVWCEFYPGTITIPTQWRCAKKHLWRTSYHQIRNGSHCPKCSREARSERLKKAPRGERGRLKKNAEMSPVSE